MKIYGNIKNPGIYELKEGEILKKLIDKAGGFINNKDNLGLDLDSVLQDGQVIYINFR
ncbi:MAG: SLBB domain-containing protein [Leptospiraceae bacterium]|nr:SLBB domain-containing protein [Leptospiraceae bacterium]MCP5494608.1 SLBB domain-containing protein [Leptospiraceae bacterium]